MAKLLIIEDEPALVKSLEIALRGKHQVFSALTGMEGLALAKAKHPNFIFLDVMLPDTTGFDILRQLKEDDKTSRIPVLVATNLSDAETISKILAAGGRDYVVKSDWSMKAIIKKIESYL